MTVLEAVRNNAEWCAAMCRTHGIGGVFTGSAWTSRRRTPTLYPDAVTLRPDAELADVLDAIDTTRSCTIKDSFACLDLSDDGFEPIVEAQWIDHPAGRPAPPAPTPWAAVSTAPELTEWESAWNGGPTGLFRPQLLAHPAVRVLAARRDGAIVAGAVLHHSASVTGVTNLFAVDGNLDDAWAGVRSALPDRRLVGYENGTVLTAAIRLGFIPTGPLRVWLRTAPD